MTWQEYMVRGRQDEAVAPRFVGRDGRWMLEAEVVLSIDGLLQKFRNAKAAASSDKRRASRGN